MNNEEVLKKLDIIIKLLAVEKINGLTAIDQVRYLKNAGLRDKQISEIIGKPINIVTAYTSRIKKK